jgi:insertion element IS1 protein InsB
MECKYCGQPCRRSGRQRNGVQRYYCKGCSRYQQEKYHYRACNGAIHGYIRSLSCESIGIRGIARVLGIAAGTVSSRIQLLAKGIKRPVLGEKGTFEVDELWTYVGRKDNDYWVAYALNRQTRQVVDFVIGKRTKATLKELIDRLLLSKPKIIRTDRLTLYQRIIPKGIHLSGSYCINRIERKNLSIRTHLKRLSRRTICFNRSIVMLESCLKLYFWK